MGFKKKSGRSTKSKKPKSKPKKQKIITCGQKFGCGCEEHGNLCEIPVEFPSGDERSEWMDKLVALGAERHGPDSEHRCFVCEAERRRNSPFSELHVEGLDEMNQVRINEINMNRHRFIRKPDQGE
jgi:hypothetical protein